jgi:hypothetical protein
MRVDNIAGWALEQWNELPDRPVKNDYTCGQQQTLRDLLEVLGYRWVKGKWIRIIPEDEHAEIIQKGGF